MNIFSKSLLSLVSFPLALLLLLPAQALAMKDTDQNQVRVSFTTEKGERQLIEVYGMSHEITSPRDAASGLPTGKRQHKPLTITKEFDKASPVLMRVLTNNENITEWRMSVSSVNKKGNLQLVRSVVLTKPSVCGISSTLEDGQSREREHISFCYQKITWTWQDGGIIAEDDWETPAS